MGAVKYRSEFTLDLNQDWKIDIWDDTYASTVSTFDVDSNGFTLSYNGGDDILNPIIGSELKFTAIASDQAFENFIFDMIGSQETRFLVYVYRDTTLYWHGNIMTDLITKADSTRPFKFDISCTDGFGRLKDVQYLNAGSLWSGRETFAKHLVNILSNLQTDDLIGVDDAYLLTCVDWYEDYMSSAYTDDPLALSDLDHLTFKFTNDYGVIEAMDCYAVLEEICKAWHARVIQSSGKFYFIQPATYFGASHETRAYKKGGVYLSAGSATTIRRQSTEIKRLDGLYRWLPALQRAKTTYNYKQGSAGEGNLLPFNYTFNTQESIGDIQGGTNETLAFNGSFRVYISWDEDPPPGGTNNPYLKWVLVYRVKLIIGTNYFENEDGYDAWDTATTDYWEYKTPQFKAPHTSGQDYTDIFPFGFETPPIPASGAGTFEFEFVRYEDQFGADISGPLGGLSFTHTTECLNFNLQLLMADGLPQDGGLKYEAVNTTDGSTPVSSTSELDLGETIIGDGPNIYTSTRIKVTNGALWENSNAWQVAAAGSSYDFNQLRVREALALQLSPTIVYDGTIRPTGKTYHIYPAYAVYIPYDSDGDGVDESYYHLILGQGTFTAQTEQWSGTWICINIDRTNIDDATALDVLPKSAGGSGSYTVTNIINEASDFINQGTEVLTARTPAAITFRTELADDAFAVVPLFGVTAQERVVPVYITLKSTTGFTVTSSVDCTFNWIAVRI